MFRQYIQFNYFFFKKKKKQTFINLFKKYEGQAIWLIDQEVSTQEQNRFE